jgi:hypothetical protein
LQRSSGGRRAENLQLHAGLGVLVGIDIGATSLDLAVLASRPAAVLAQCMPKPPTCSKGPGVVLARVRVLIRELLAQCGLRQQSQKT